MASLALAILVSAPAFPQATDGNVTADLVIQVQELQEEVRNLRGQIEMLQGELQGLRERQRDQYLDLDQRISELGGTAPSGPRGVVAGEAAAGGAAEDSTPAAQPAAEAGQPSLVSEQPEPVPAEPEAPEVRPPMVESSITAGIGQPAVESVAAAATPEAEKASYDKAFAALKELRYADAAEGFNSFLEDYPDSEFADNAQYWLGESYYATSNYEIALEAFNELITRFPDSPKVPDAMLKVGYTHYSLKQWDQARATLIEVTNKYPGTTLARLADSRLRSMRVEGNY